MNELEIRNRTKTIADRVALAAVNSVGFWSEQLYDFRLSEGASSFEVSENPGRKWVIIVARNHYFETVKDYPVGSLRDLHRILKAEPWRYPFKGKLFYRVQRRSDQSHRVTSWVIKQSVLESLSSQPIWLIPESVCVEALAEGNNTVLNRLGEDLFVGKSPIGLVSGVGEANTFSKKIGLPSSFYGQSEVQVLSGPESIDIILLGVERTVKSSPFVFFYRDMSSALLALPWRKALSLSAVMIVFYLSLVSLYIQFEGLMLDRQISALSDGADGVVELRKKLASKGVVLKALDSKLLDSNPHWDGWSVYLDLKDLGVQFIAVTTSKSSMTIICVAPKATEVLRVLVADPRVRSAEFSSPIRQDTGGELFTIEITYRNIDSFLDSYVPIKGELKELLEVNQPSLTSMKAVASRPSA